MYIASPVHLTRLIPKCMGNWNITRPMVWPILPNITLNRLDHILRTISIPQPKALQWPMP